MSLARTIINFMAMSIPTQWQLTKAKRKHVKVFNKCAVCGTEDNLNVVDSEKKLSKFMSDNDLYDVNVERYRVLRIMGYPQDWGILLFYDEQLYERKSSAEGFTHSFFSSSEFKTVHFSLPNLN